MKKIVFLLVAAVTLLAGCNKIGSFGSYTGKKPGAGTDSVSYAVGLLLANIAKSEGVDSTFNIELMARGLHDGIANKTPLFGGDTVMLVMLKHFNPDAYTLYQSNLLKEQAFFKDNAKKAGVKSTPSGLQYEVISQGTGEKPVETSTVKVHYTGTLLDGKVFDSSVERGEPTTFALNQVIKGWTEGLQLMTVGSKYKFYIPGTLAYGVQGSPQGGIDPGEPLIFEVELLSVEAPQPQMSQEELQKAIEEAMKNQGAPQ